MIGVNAPVCFIIIASAAFAIFPVCIAASALTASALSASAVIASIVSAIIVNIPVDFGRIFRFFFGIFFPEIFVVAHFFS